MDTWLKENLVCPLDYTTLSVSEKHLSCRNGHQFPYIHGIPVMLIPDAAPTHAPHFARTQELVANRNGNSIGQTVSASGNSVDPYVQQEIAATCGIMYKNLAGKLKRYPIPKLPLNHGAKKFFLDLGCNWGRWSMSAAKAGFSVVGVDPSLEAIQAAKRISEQLGIHAVYLVADARYLPFRPESFDVIFSYSVLQHFDKHDAQKTLVEIHRLLRPSGVSWVQMLNAYGIRNQYHILRRNFRMPTAFEVRYWPFGELKENFNRFIGPTSVSVDGFFSANAQTEDLDLLSFQYKCVVYLSQFLKTVSQYIAPLKTFADSLYLTSQKAQ